MEPPPVNPYAPPAASLETAAGGPHAPASGEYRPLFGRATAVTVILGLNILLEIGGAANSAVTISVMNRVAAGEQVARESLVGIDERAAAIGVLQLLIILGSVISFCMLMARANRNAASYGQMQMEFTPGWAVGYFFIPVVSLWMPYRAMREIWRASEPTPDERLDVRFAEVPVLLPAWWAAYVLHGIAGQVSFQFTRNPHAASDFINAGYVNIVEAALTIVAAALAIALVRALARRQDACQKAAEAFRAARRAASPA
jgi:hypothetical protein